MMLIEIQYVINYYIGPRKIPKSSDLSSDKIQARDGQGNPVLRYPAG